jgi:predicted AAA+ superfamily ATPase
MPRVNIVPRPAELARIREGMAYWPVTILFGPRQVGKTTLVESFASCPDNYFDLHQPIDRVRMEESNFRILDGLDGIVVIDEAQEMPALFEKLRVLADRRDRQTRFILTGSVSPKISDASAESLTGRVRRLSLSGFSLAEVGPENWERLWLRGGFPDAYTKELDEVAMEVRQQYLANVLTRDLPALTEIKLTGEQVYRLFRLMAHHHGQYWNHTEVGGVLGVNTRTVQRYVELFKAVYLVRELPPYFENFGKRLRKAPKLYIRDTGLLHTLLNIRDRPELYASPRYGASWEGFGIEQLVSLLQLPEEQCYTWSVQGGAEVDLVLTLHGGLVGVEFKAGDAPRKTRSMTAAVDTLKLRKLFIVYPGAKDYAIDEVVEAIGIVNLPKLAKLLGRTASDAASS